MFNNPRGFHMQSWAVNSKPYWSWSWSLSPDLSVQVLPCFSNWAMCLFPVLWGCPQWQSSSLWENVLNQCFEWGFQVILRNSKRPTSFKHKTLQFSNAVLSTLLRYNRWHPDSSLNVRCSQYSDLWALSSVWILTSSDKTVIYLNCWLSVSGFRTLLFLSFTTNTVWATRSKR